MGPARADKTARLRGRAVDEEFGDTVMIHDALRQY